MSKIHFVKALTIKEKEKVRINKLKNPKASIDYLQTIDPIDYNPKKKRNSL